MWFTRPGLLTCHGRQRTRSSSMSHPITLSILNAYFSRVYSLHAYLDTIRIPQADTQVNDALLLPTDPPSYSQFLSHSFVAFSGEVPPSGQPQFIMTQSFDSMRIVRPFPCLSSAGSDEEPQVITRAQERLFSGPKQKGANVITMGYRGVCILWTLYTHSSNFILQSLIKTARRCGLEIRALVSIISL